MDEEVTGISWMRSQGTYNKMLTMNNKVVKMWKIYEKPDKKIIRSASKDLVLPRFQVLDNSVNAVVQY